MVAQYETSEPRGDVTAQLKDIERQGGGMARFAHICAALLLVAGSLGSLISISAPAFYAFLRALQAGRLDLPDLINAVVGVLLVLAGDAALLYSASVLRVLRASQAPRDEMHIHEWVIAGVSVLEAGTFLYMAYVYDHPSNLVLWLIDIGRAIAWPLLCAYLSMARPLPVGPRDIMYHSALASGRGLVTDIATLSADPTAPMHHKAAIYRAASKMKGTDRTQLDELVTVLAPAPVVEPAVALWAPEPTPEPPTPPNGGLRLLPPAEPARRSVVRTPRPSDAPASYETMAKDAFKAGATSIKKMQAATGMSRTAAAGWVRTLKEGAKGSAVRTGRKPRKAVKRASVPQDVPATARVSQDEAFDVAAELA